jgi:hypothetical protein
MSRLPQLALALLLCAAGCWIWLDGGSHVAAVVAVAAAAVLAAAPGLPSATVARRRRRRPVDRPHGRPGRRRPRG